MGFGNAALRHAPARHRVSRCSVNAGTSATSRRTQDRRRCGFDRLPRRASPAGVDHLGREAEDRRLSVHHNRAQPRCRVGGEHTFTVADVPGLIPVPSEGRGLGLDFPAHRTVRSWCMGGLRHAGARSRSAVRYRRARGGASRLSADTAGRFDFGDLADRPRAVVLNKIDVPDARELAEFVRADIAERGWPIFEVSAVSREGLRELIFARGRWSPHTKRSVPPGAQAPGDPADRGERERLHRRSRSGNPGGLSCGATRPERWVAQTDFVNDEAVGYLGDRLARLGVEAELLRLGAKPGCAVTIGDMTFDWEPQTPAGWM